MPGPDPQCLLALDVGGTSMKGAVVDSDDAAGTGAGDPSDGGLSVVAERRFPTRAEAGPDRVVAAIGAAALELRAAAERTGRRPVALGLVVPGVVDEDRGIAVEAANLGWHDAPLARMVADRTGLPVALGHDVRAGGLAENRLGAGRGARDLLFVALGTGVAAACVVDGRLLVAGGYAGEIGHLVVEPGGELCGCGGRGCLERVASAAAIARRFSARAGREVAGADEVAALVRRGDPVAAEVWAQAVDALADVLLTSMTLLGPEVLVLGGGLAEAGELLLAPVRRSLDERRTFQRPVRLVRARLGERAACLGAALLVRDRCPPR